PHSGKARRSCTRMLALPAIARMAACEPFIAMLVVSSDTSHKLLCLRGAGLSDLSKKLLRSRAAQRGRKRTTVQNLDFTGLASPIREAEIGFRGCWHFRLSC